MNQKASLPFHRILAVNSSQCRPKFEPETKKTRKMQESQINSPRFSRNSWETSREETLVWALFERFSQRKLEKTRLVPFPISTTCNVPGVWHDCCQFGTIDNIEGNEHENINLNFVSWNFQWNPFLSHSLKGLGRRSTTWSRMVVERETITKDGSGW